MDIQQFEERKTTVYGFISDKAYTPMKAKEIAQFLNVPRAEKEDFASVLDALVVDGKIIIDQRGKVKKADENSVAGVFSGTSKGFGFVSVEGETGDIFIAPDNVNGARDKDKVLISILDTYAPKGRSREGVVLSILERGNSCVIGTFQRTKTYGFVVPDNQKFGSDIYIPHGFTKGAVTGHKVEVEITDFGNSDKNAEGHRYYRTYRRSEDRYHERYQGLRHSCGIPRGSYQPADHDPGFCSARRYGGKT